MQVATLTFLRTNYFVSGAWRRRRYLPASHVDFTETWKGRYDKERRRIFYTATGTRKAGNW